MLLQLQELFWSSHSENQKNTSFLSSLMILLYLLSFLIQTQVFEVTEMRFSLILFTLFLGTFYNSKLLSVYTMFFFSLSLIVHTANVDSFIYWDIVNIYLALFNIKSVLNKKDIIQPHLSVNNQKSFLKAS